MSGGVTGEEGIRRAFPVDAVAVREGDGRVKNTNKSSRPLTFDERRLLTGIRARGVGLYVGESSG